jgi:peptidoglycan/xylan/chitin deacetylase (PgdA/CDA1 family)
MYRHFLAAIFLIYSLSTALAALPEIGFASTLGTTKAVALTFDDGEPHSLKLLAPIQSYKFPLV